MLRKAHADNNVVNALHDELLCEQQRRSLDNRLAMIVDTPTDVRIPPPGLGTPMPTAAASPMPGLSFSKLSGTGGEDGSSCPQPCRNQGYGYDSFGEQPSNSQNPPQPHRSRRKGGDFPNDHDDDNDDDDDDDDGSGVYAHRCAQVIGWCDICKKKILGNQGYVWCVSCSKRVMHVKCLNAIGRKKPECPQCEDIKVKIQKEEVDRQMTLMATMMEKVDPIGAEGVEIEKIARKSLQEKMLSRAKARCEERP
eukprot:4178449-Amphidinium_carterae.1